MLKIENVETSNWRAAVRGMRNPLESWEKSDSIFLDDVGGNNIGVNDLNLMKRLVNAGTDHSKFMRMITVSFDITAPLYWWKEFDTYKIAVVRNSCSTMHKIEARELVYGDFATDGLTSLDMLHLQDTIRYINVLINDYKQATGENKLSIHRRIVKLLPDSYLQKATITTNYQVLRSIRNSDRKTHKLLEWREDFMKFIDSLPYAKELLINDDLYKYELIDKEYQKIIESGDRRALAHFKMKHNFTLTPDEMDILDEDRAPGPLYKFLERADIVKRTDEEYNEALQGIKTYASKSNEKLEEAIVKKDPCAGYTCFSEDKDNVYCRCVDCTHTYNPEECYHYFECTKKGTGVAIPDKDIVNGLVIEPGAFNGEEF